MRNKGVDPAQENIQPSETNSLIYSTWKPSLGFVKIVFSKVKGILCDFNAIFEKNFRFDKVYPHPESHIFLFFCNISKLRSNEVGYEVCNAETSTAMRLRNIGERIC